MLIHKYKLLVSKGRLKDYVTAGCEILAFYFRDVYNRPEVKGVVFESSTHIQVNQTNMQ